MENKDADKGENMRKIVCFGDSNTYGYITETGRRYKKKVRWPGRLEKLLGDSYQVVEEGLCGRTSAFEDRTEPGLCGLDSIERVIKEQEPLDLLVVMLGSNDCKTQFAAFAEEITEGVKKVIQKARESSTEGFKVLLIAPAMMTEKIADSSFGTEFDARSVAVSKELAQSYQVLAESEGVSFLDGSLVTRVGEADGLHLAEEGHQMLAEAVYQKILEIMERHE